MALIDQLGAVDPIGIASGLIADAAPDLVQNPTVDPISVANRLIRKGLDSRQQRALKQSQSRPESEGASVDFAAFGDPDAGPDTEPPKEAPPESPKKEQPDTIGWSGVPGAIAKGTGRGVIDAAGNTLKGAGVGANRFNEAVTQSMEAGVDPTTGMPMPAVDMRGPNGEARKPVSPQENPLYKAGQSVENFAERAIPATEAEKGSLSYRVPHAVAGMAPYVAGAILAPEAAVPIAAGAAAQFGLSSAGETFDAAIKKGASVEDASKAAGLAGLIGAAVGVLPLGAVLRPFEKFMPEASGYAARMLAQAGQNGLVFATIGEAQEYLLQQVAKEFYDPKAGYSPDVKRLMEGLLTGGILGGAHAGAERYQRGKAVEDLYAQNKAAAPAAGTGPTAGASPGIGGPSAPGAGPSSGGAGATGGAGPGPQGFRTSPGGPGGPTPGSTPPPFESQMRPKLRKLLESKAAYYKEHSAEDIASWSDDQLKEYVNTKFGGGSAKSEEAPQQPKPEQPKPQAEQPRAKPEAAKPNAEEMAPDQPSAEPLSDLKAQLADLHDPAHPRAAVWLPKSSVEHVGRAGLSPEVLKGSPVIQDFDGQGGVLIARDQEVAQQAKAELDKGVPLQTVVGKLTGAGEGKPADATHVVQQHDKDGNVTRERGVRQADVAKTQKEFAAEGRTVKVMSPQDAIKRRADMVAKEGTAGTRDNPIDIKTADDVARAASVARTDHSHAQGEANNVQRGHIKWNGGEGEYLEGTIEVAAGGTRKGTNPKTGKPWETTHTVPYGDWKGTEAADGMRTDFYLGPEPNAGHPVYVLDEKDEKTGKFRQPKTFVGFPSHHAAVEAYLGTSTKKPEHIGGMRALSAPEFKAWLKSGGGKAPASDAMAQHAGNKVSNETGTSGKPGVLEVTVPGPNEGGTGGADQAMADLASMFNEPGPEDHAAVETAIKASGHNPARVRPADIQTAAELIANNGMSPEHAFMVAVAHNLIADGTIKFKDAEQVLGHEAATGLLQAVGGTGGERQPSAEAPGATAGGKTVETSEGVGPVSTEHGEEVPARGVEPVDQAHGGERPGEQEGVPAADTTGAEAGRGAVGETTGGERNAEATERGAGEAGKPAGEGADQVGQQNAGTAEGAVSDRWITVGGVLHPDQKTATLERDGFRASVFDHERKAINAAYERLLQAFEVTKGASGKHSRIIGAKEDWTKGEWNTLQYAETMKQPSVEDVTPVPKIDAEEKKAQLEDEMKALDQATQDLESGKVENEPVTESFDQAFDSALDDVFGAAPAKTEKTLPAANGKPPSAVARQGVPSKISGGTADQAMAGLTELFNGPKPEDEEELGAAMAMAPGGAPEKGPDRPEFNEAVYARARPMFEAAASKFSHLSNDLGGLVRGVVQQMQSAHGLTRDGLERMRPYLQRFVGEVRSGAIKLASAPSQEHIKGQEQADEHGNIPSENPEALAGVSAGEGGRAEGGGPPAGGNAGLGESGAGGVRATQEGGLAGPRGGRGRGEEVRVPDAGRPGSGPVRGTESGTGRGRAGVSGEPAGGLGHVDPAAAPSIPGVDFTIGEDVHLGSGGEVQKFNDNINAIKIVKAVEREERRATADEQRALARYVGWGGLANAFNDPSTGQWKAGWEKRGQELADLLTPQELRAARSSTRNAHYTSETVVKAMWDAAKHLGFKGGLTLELSAGTGNFLGLIPKDLHGKTKFIAVEQDSITSRITKLLYPQATVLHAGLHEVPLADGEAVLNIGNPPFGSESLRFQYKPELHGLSIHNQFFAAGIDAVRPGGLHINVVSRYLMDAQDESARRMLAGKAELVGVIRLPDTAFKENARTEVVTDIVIMQRRMPDDEKQMTEMLALASAPAKGPDAEIAKRRAERMIPDWVKTTKVRDPLGGEAITVNSYIAGHPDMVMGRLERSGSMREQNDVTVTLDKSENLGKRLKDAIGKLPKDIHNLEPDVLKASLERHKSMSEALEIAVAGNEPGHIETKDGKLQLVYERETPAGGQELARREITPKSPWSRQLYMDDKGQWFTLGAKTNEKGEKVKAEGSKRNVYERQYYAKNNVPDSLRLGEQKFERLKQAVELRDLVKKQIVMETTDVPAAEMEVNRKQLAKAYKAYVGKHGLLNDQKNASLLYDMPDGALVMALELNYRPPVTNAKAARTGEKAHPAEADEAPILSRRVVPKYEPASNADSPQDALSISLSESGRVDMDRIASLLGSSPEKTAEILQAGDKPLVYLDPELGVWETADSYLSGQVARKLKAARQAGLPLNIKALEAVQPAKWSAGEIVANIGSTWVPGQVYADFVQHLVGAPAVVRFARNTNTFDLRMESADPAKLRNWRTDAMPFEKILGGMLNSRVPKVRLPDEDGKPGPIDQEATALVALKASEIENEFADWVFKDSTRRAKLVDIFNEKFNTRVNRQNDGSHLKMPGKVPDAIITMRRHQKNAIWRGIHSRYELLDHVVGSGKTFTAIATMMERRRMGLSRKPMVAVPNHLVDQWASDVYRLYPGAKVLAARNNQFDRQSRRRLFAKIATGDWDIVIVPHSSFGFIGIAKETELRFLDEELRIAQEAVKEAEEQAVEDGIAGGRGKPFNVKEAERLVTTITTRMDRLKNAKRDRLLTFEQMGVDYLAVDEAHEFKNLFYSSRLTGVRGMGNKTGSKKVYDLYNKVRVLRESPSGSVAFMTGTPISNSAVEMFTMMRYLAADDLKDLGLEHFDAWRAQSVTATPAFEPTEAGGLKEVTRLGRTWSNMRALMELYYSFTDAVPQEDITRWYAEDNKGAPFPVPRVQGGQRKEVVVKPTPAQVQILQDVVSGFNNLPNESDPFERNKQRLRLMDRARKVSLDARVAVPGHTSPEEGGKLDAIADNVARLYKQWHADKGTQLVFLDRGVPKAKGDQAIIKAYDELIAKRDKARLAGDEEAYRAVIDKLDTYDPNEIAELRIAQTAKWNAYQQLKDNLIKRGIPAEEIRFVQEANSDAEKKAMFDNVNDGIVRVLIGSTQRMGAGTNVQERLVGLHHGDVGWKPSDIEQREGRIIRQGNHLLDKYGHDKFEVEIKAYVTERSIDAKMWAINAEKLRMINGIRKYDGAFTMEFSDEEAVGMAEIAALASGDPKLLERVKLKAEIDRLELQERAHRRKVHGLEDAIESAERALRDYPAQIEAVKKAAAELEAPYQQMAEEATHRNATVEGVKYSTGVDAAQAVEKAITAQQAGNDTAKYSISINKDHFTNKADIEEALQNTFGDAKPFEATIDGQMTYRRAIAARAIFAKLSPILQGMAKAKDIETKETVKLGQYLGNEIEITVERDDRDASIDIALMKDGRTLAAASGAASLDMSYTLPSARALLDKLTDDVDNVRESTGGYLQKRIDTAKAELPGLREDLGKPFGKAVELHEKRLRLKAVIDELAARTKAAEGGGGKAAPAAPDEEELFAGMALGPPVETPNGTSYPVQDALEHTELARKLTDLIHRITGQRITVQYRDQMAVGRSPLGWGDDRGAHTIGGLYLPLSDVIRIALGDHRFPDKPSTAFHESWHAVEDHFVNDQEMGLLKREEPRLRKMAAEFYGLKPEDVADFADFEIRAMAFQSYAHDREQGGRGGSGVHIGVRRIFERLMKLFRAIANYLRGLGFQTYEDVFARAYEGGMKERPSRKDEGLGSRIADQLLEQRAAASAQENARAENAKPVQAVEAAMAKKPEPPEKVISAAVRVNGRVFAGVVHADAMDAAAKVFGSGQAFDDGFITSSGRFVDREEATKIVNNNDQPLISDPQTQRPLDQREYPVDVLHSDHLMAWDADDAEIDRNNQAMTDATRAPEAHHPKEFLNVDGKPAWAMVVDNTDHAVLGTIRYEDAKDADFHHNFYVPHHLLEKVNAGEATLAWADDKGIQSFTQLPPDMLRDLQQYYGQGEIGAAMAVAPRPRPPGSIPRSIGQRIRDRIAAMLESKLAGKIAEGYQDLSAPVKKLQNELEERRGAPFNDLSDFYTRKRVYPGRVGNEVDLFNKAHLDPMVAYMKAHAISLESAGDYVYAKHVAERNAELGKRYPPSHQFHKAMYDRTLVGASGRSREWAENILREVARLGKTAQYEQVAIHIAAIREYVLHKLVDGGLITPETAQEWRAKYQHYVDLRGFEDDRDEAPEDYREPARFNVRGKEIKQAFGRGSKADNPIINMLDQAYRSVDRAERNRYLHAVWNAFGRMNADNPGSISDIVKLDRGKRKKVIDPRTGLVKEVSDSSYAGSPNTVTTKIAGIPHHMVFENRDMAEAVKRMAPEGLGMFQGLLNIQNKLKSLWTHYSPDFLFRHFMFRYPIEGTLNSFEQKEGGTHSALKYIQEGLPFLGSASKAIFASNKGTPHADPEIRAMQVYWKEMRNAGGAMMFRNSRDMDLLREHLQTQLMALKGKPTASAREKWRRAIEAMDVVTNALDNSLRLAAYASARRQGKTPQQAALIAREATVDFQLKGKWANAIGLWFPFGNVAIQTGMRMTKAVGRSKIMRRVFMGTMLAGFLTAAFNYLVGGDDTDGVPFFEKLPEWDRRLNFIILNPFDKDEKGRPTPIKIPMPYNWAFPLMMGYGFGTTVFGKESIRKTLGTVLHSGLEVATPFGQEENKAAMLAPELARPFVHIYTNQDYTGRPIHQNPDFQTKPNAESGRRDIGGRVRTGEGWKYIARSLNGISGGSRNKSGMLDFYPEDIRHIFDYVGGTQRRLGANLYQTGQSIVTGNAPDPTHVPLERVIRGTDYDAADRALRFERSERQKRPWLPH